MASTPGNQLELPFRLPPAPVAAERHILLGNRIVTYRLTRTRRSSIGVVIDQSGVRVGAPRSVAVAEVEGFLRKHGQWVLRKLDAWRHSRSQRAFVVRDGAALPVVGETLPIRIAAGAGRVRFEGKQIVVEAGPNADARELLVCGLRGRALDVFRERLAAHASRMGLALPRLALSDARTRWGSCSRGGGIRLNWRLIHLPLRLIDYVIVHELAHLEEMNHSPRFWSVVERMLPDYRAARDELRARHYTMPEL
jgi:hypothetical protein